jgi:hypothetical protein
VNITVAAVTEAAPVNVSVRRITAGIDVTCGVGCKVSRGGR